MGNSYFRDSQSLRSILVKNSNSDIRVNDFSWCPAQAKTSMSHCGKTQLLGLVKVY